MLFTQDELDLIAEMALASLMAKMVNDDGGDQEHVWLEAKTNTPANMHDIFNEFADEARSGFRWGEDAA